MNMTRVITLVTLTVLVSIGSTATAQQPVVSLSSIEGIVVKTGTNDPLPERIWNCHASGNSCSAIEWRCR